MFGLKDTFYVNMITSIIVEIKLILFIIKTDQIIRFLLQFRLYSSKLQIQKF